MKKILLFLIFVVLVQLQSSLGQKKSDKIELKRDSTYLLLNKKLPPFQLKDLQGKTFNSSQLLGKPTMINFWAMGCIPCAAEIPFLNRLKEKYGSKMNFISINPQEIYTYSPISNHNQNFQLSSVIKYLEKNSFNFQHLGDGRSYIKKLKIPGYPTNLFIDREGYVRDIQIGFPVEKDPKTGKSIQVMKAYEAIIEKLTKS
jgi:thiol-disulfide isomerase/thioredoxin